MKNLLGIACVSALAFLPALNIPQSNQLTVERVAASQDESDVATDPVLEQLESMAETVNKTDTAASGFASRIDSFETDLTKTLSSIRDQVDEIRKTSVRDIRTLKTKVAKIEKANYQSEIDELKRRLEKMESGGIAISNSSTTISDGATVTQTTVPAFRDTWIPMPAPIISTPRTTPVTIQPYSTVYAQPVSPPRTPVRSTLRACSDFTAGYSSTNQCRKCPACGKIHCR